jgi:uncharacterized membrane protein
VLAVAIAALLVGWPAYGALHDDFAVPVGYLDGRDFHFHGAAAWLMFAGFACQAASILVVVWLRLKANPGGKTGQNVAVILASVGAFIILAMLFLKMMGLV